MVLSVSHYVVLGLFCIVFSEKLVFFMLWKKNGVFGDKCFPLDSNIM